MLFRHKKEILPFATTWMDLKDIMLNEISQREKDKYCMISLTCGILKRKKNQAHRFKERIGRYQRQGMKWDRKMEEGNF